MSSLHRTELEVKLNGLRELMELKKTIYEQVKTEPGECSPSGEMRRAQAGAVAPGAGSGGCSSADKPKGCSARSARGFQPLTQRL